MKKLLTFVLLAAGMILLNPLWGQGRLVLANSGYVVIDNAGFVVLDNPNANAITLGTGGGNIVSEAENDVIRWNIGASTGTYQIPWTTRNNVKIPLTVSLTSAGTGSGHFVLSTHPDNDAVNNWNNDDYKPTDVTTMAGFNLVNNSPNCIDRFWRIEQTGYGIAPQANLTFGYDDAERTNPGNTIPAGTMVAQQFNNVANTWIYPGSGADNYPTFNVNNAQATTSFFKSWTLTTQSNQLPWKDDSQVDPQDAAGPQMIVYPNPVSGDRIQVLVTGMEKESVRLELFDLAGRSLAGLMTRIESQTQELGLDLPASLASGFYLLSLKDGAGHQQLVKIRILDR